MYVHVRACVCKYERETKRLWKPGVRTVYFFLRRVSLSLSGLGLAKQASPRIHLPSPKDPLVSASPELGYQQASACLALPPVVLGIELRSPGL